MVLRQNVVSSDYYKTTCLGLTTWDEVVDEIYYNVKHVEPWLGGNARGASTAFCLMCRLCGLKLNEKQIKDLLDHHDSPYIRAVGGPLPCLLPGPPHSQLFATLEPQVGFLMLRYVADPKTLWSWYAPYVKDPEVCFDRPA